MTRQNTLRSLTLLHASKLLLLSLHLYRKQQGSRTSQLVVGVGAPQRVGLALAVEHAHHGLPQVGAYPGQGRRAAGVAARLHHRPRAPLGVGALE